MARRCTVCIHPQRAEIDKELVQYRAYRDIGRRYGLDKTPLWHHREDHLPEQLTQATQAQNATAATDLYARLETWIQEAESILRLAKSAGEYSAATAAIREARGCLETLAKLQGKLASQPTINLQVNAEWLSVQATVVQALSPYPEAQAAVVSALTSGSQTNGPVRCT